MSPATKGMHWNERGIALVTALMITLLLTLVVVALSYRVGLFSMGARDRIVKSQSLYTAEMGLSEARYYFMAKDCIPPNWGACIAGINNSSFTNMSANFRSLFATPVPEIPVAGERFNVNLGGSFSHNGYDNYNYQVLARTTNIPKVLNVVVVSEKPGSGSRTVIDAGLIFTKPLGSDYKQFGQMGTREGLSGETVGADSDKVRTRF